MGDTAELKLNVTQFCRAHPGRTPRSVGRPPVSPDHTVQMRRQDEGVLPRAAGLGTRTTESDRPWEN